MVLQLYRAFSYKLALCFQFSFVWLVYTLRLRSFTTAYFIELMIAYIIMLAGRQPARAPQHWVSWKAGQHLYIHIHNELQNSTFAFGKHVHRAVCMESNSRFMRTLKTTHSHYIDLLYKVHFLAACAGGRFEKSEARICPFCSKEYIYVYIEKNMPRLLNSGEIVIPIVRICQSFCAICLQCRVSLEV